MNSVDGMELGLARRGRHSIPPIADGNPGRRGRLVRGQTSRTQLRCTCKSVHTRVCACPGCELASPFSVVCVCVCFHTTGVLVSGDHPNRHHRPQQGSGGRASCLPIWMGSLSRLEPLQLRGGLWKLPQSASTPQAPSVGLDVQMSPLRGMSGQGPA